MIDTTKGSRWTYTAREAVGVFANATALESAVDALETAGFDRAAISVLATEGRAGQRIESLYKTAKEAEDSASAPQAAFVSKDSRIEGEALAIGGPFYVGGVAGAFAVAASGGALALALAAALVGGSAAAGLGALLANAIARRHADQVAGQLKTGGLVLWVAVRDRVAEERARKILQDAGAQDVHVHEIQRDWNLRDLPLADVQPDPILERDAWLDEDS